MTAEYGVLLFTPRELPVNSRYPNVTPVGIAIVRSLASSLRFRNENQHTCNPRKALVLTHGSHYLSEDSPATITSFTSMIGMRMPLLKYTVPLYAARLCKGARELPCPTHAVHLLDNLECMVNGY